MKKLKQHFKLKGKVIHGEKVGRKIGFPTANLKTTPKNLKIKQGVYLAKCKIKNTEHHALAYYGQRFIFNQKRLSFEIYIYNFSENIYGKTVQVRLLEFMRRPKKIHKLSNLRKLLELDKKNGNELINNNLL